MRVIRLGFRFMLIALVATMAVLRYGVRRLVAGRLSPLGRERLRGRVLAETFERLGAAFVKFGQILSTRPDLLGAGYVEELARLQDDMPPVDFSQVCALLDAELSPDARRRITWVEPTALAAASVAQVHRGRLDTGESVAIKVQRPDARAQIERDVTLMRIGAHLLEVIPSMKMLSLVGAVEYFGEAMKAQLDFVQEADNNRRFARSFTQLEGIAVPALFDALCTRHLLVMELIEGVKATEPERVGGDRVKLARRGYEVVLQMIFRDGFVHADMHPGNLILTNDDRVVLIDLGLVAEIPDEMMRPWCETFAALSQRDGKEVSRLFYVYAPSVATRDYAAYESEVVAFFEGLYGKSMREVEIGAVVSGAMGILRRHRVQIDPVFTVVNIALLVAEGLGKQLDPTLDPVALAGPYVMQALLDAPPGKAPLREASTGRP